MKNNKLKILLINDYFDLVGGTERYVLALQKELSHKNYVYFFGFGNENISKNNAIIIKISNNKILKYFRDSLFSPRIYFFLKQYIKKIKPDIIHVNNNNIATISVLMAIKDSKTPAIRTVHDYGFICPTGLQIKPNGIICNKKFGINCLRSKCVSSTWFIRHIFEKKARFYLNRKVFKMYMSHTLNLKKMLERNNVQPVTCLPPFTEISQKTKRIVNVEKNSILYVGALRKYKGVDYLLKAIHLVKERVPDVKLYIIGTGKDDNLFRETVKKLNIEKNVFFMGRVSDIELINFYKKTEMLVVPSVWLEQFAIVGIEALSQGKPVIGSNIGGIPEWLEDGKNGFLVEPKNHIDISKRIITLLENKEIAKKMGKYGRINLKKKYSKKKHISKLEEIYRALVISHAKK